MEFEILLGECGMASSAENLNGNNFIKFSQAFSFGKPPANEYSVSLSDLLNEISYKFTNPA